MLLLYVQLCARLCQGEKTLFCPLEVYRLVGQQNQPVGSRRKQVHTPLPFTMTGREVKRKDILCAWVCKDGFLEKVVLIWALDNRED